MTNYSNNMAEFEGWIMNFEAEVAVLSLVILIYFVVYN